MPRPKKPGSGEPKTRSRHGCWPCKHRKIKCGEEKPCCLNCQRNGEKCDYSIVLNWQGRNKKGGSPGNNMLGTASFSTMQYSPDSQPRKPQPPSASQQQSSTNQMRFEKDSQISPKRDYQGAFNDYTDSSRVAIENIDLSHHHHQQQQQQRPLDSATTRNIDPSLSRIRALGTESYPSPAETNVGSPPGSGFPIISSNNTMHSTSLTDQMPPPIPSLPYQPLPPLPNHAGHSRQTSTDEQGLKRVRLSPATENFDTQYQPQPENSNGYFSTPNYTSRPKPLNIAPSNPYSPSSVIARIPPTPAASIGSDDNHASQAKPSPHRIDSPNTRRVSIQSLVSGNSPAESPRECAVQYRANDNSNPFPEKRTYGFDLGVPDLDIGENNDQDALSPYTPKKPDSSDGASSGMDFNLDECYSEFGFTLDAPTEIQQQVQQEAKSYYSRPVKVEISTAFGPLPPELSNNPMNLLYFHHFVDHTARILVPYDCSENPFKTLLPKMALQDSTLLHLLLAYSAKHRARLLHHLEPVNRIAEWMQDVLLALIDAVGKPAHEISDTNLATAIMLASLEIISPAPETDEIKISWQKHLEVARKMMLARSESSLVSHGGEINHFLTRWFAYLDVLGSLSGSGQKPLFHGNYFRDEDEDSMQSYQIDCLMGFTSRCVSILARVADLAHQCDNERLDPQGNLLPGWQPSAQTVKEAELIKSDLHKARQHVQQGCHHRRNSATDHNDPSYAVELVTTNDAFHWAGLIQLDRRVLAKPSSDTEVQFYVREIVAALTKIRPGGTAEACLLFPMFTAGCDAQFPDREPIMARLKSVESSGMFQVRQAISLVEKVWETGRSWETYIGEMQFIG